jgi:hypothetical protein
MTAVPTDARFTAAQLAHLAFYEAQPAAPESYETVERVARAIAQIDYDSEIDEDAFEYAFDELQRDEFRRYAVAAITALDAP